MELNTLHNQTKALMHGGCTHPDIATLVDPLFAARKEGTVSFMIKFILSPNPLYAKGEERVVERSKDRVSENMRANGA